MSKDLIKDIRMLKVQRLILLFCCIIFIFSFSYERNKIDFYKSIVDSSIHNISDYRIPDYNEVNKFCKSNNFKYGWVSSDLECNGGIKCIRDLSDNISENRCFN